MDGYRKIWVKGFPNHFFGDSWVAGFWRAGHANEDDRRRLGACARGVSCLPLAAWGQGAGDRKFFKALHYFTVHNITWRALPAEFGSWNSIWKRFWRLSRSGVFETFFEALASLSERAHLVQMFDSTVIRAHVSAAGAKGGRMAKHSGAPGEASQPRSISRPISTAIRSASI